MFFEAITGLLFVPTSQKTGLEGSGTIIKEVREHFRFELDLNIFDFTETLKISAELKFETIGKEDRGFTRVL